MTFLINSTKVEKFRNLYFSNQITIKIIGGGTQNILYDFFPSPPNQTLANEEEKTISSDNKISDLIEGENIIIMKWENSKVNNANYMFSQLNNLLEVDLSNFDVSEITEMNNMFNGCSNLTSVNLNNLNAPILTDMGSMFRECESLLFLNLSSFVAPLLATMENMFYQCSSLK